MVSDIAPGPDDSYPGELTALGSALYMTVVLPQTGLELWRTDGTQLGTWRLQDIQLGPWDTVAYLAASAGRLFFEADDATACSQLWSSDGSVNGAAPVAIINDGTEASGVVPFDVGGTLWLTADDGQSGRELWTSDGSWTGRGSWPTWRRERPPRRRERSHERGAVCCLAPTTA